MDVAHVSFHTNSRDGFNIDDGYDGVSITELETLLRLSRQGTISLEGELMKRQHERTSDQPGEVGKCCVRLHHTARELSVRERLSDKATKQVDDAVKILTTLQTSTPSKTYQAFLYDILRHCGTSLVLLCAASLGKKKIVDLGSKERVNLLAYVRATKISFDSPILSTLASERDMPSSDSPRISHITTKSQKRARHADVVTDGSQEEATEHTQLNKDHEQRNPEAPGKAVHQSSLQNEQEKPTAADLFSPYKRDREMKHMCTNAPASSISELPEPFKIAVQRSQLWKWERNQTELKTTGCLASLFPKDNTQDVSFTIWCGNDDGYHLTNIFGLQLAMSS